MFRKSTILLVTLILILPLMIYAGHKENSDAWLGIYTQTVDRDLSEAFDLDREQGVVIKKVIDDSPAEIAGLKRGDIILKFEGEKLFSADELTDLVLDQKPGDEVKIVIFRDGKDKTIIAELGSRDDSADENVFIWKSDKGHRRFFDKSIKEYRCFRSDSYIGVTLQNLNEQLGQYFGVDEGEGALVTEVLDDSPAQKAGLKAGDVIIQIDDKEVENPSDVQMAVRSKEEGDKVKISLLREKKEMEFNLKVEQSPGNNFGHNMDFDFDDDFLFVPQTKGFFRGNFDHDIFDGGNLRDEMDRLKEELGKMRLELKDINKRLE